MAPTPGPSPHWGGGALPHCRRMTKAGKRPISGWIILDKPYGMTSTQAVGKVRWLYAAEKAGHAGTLDPLATGLLPIALGEATKTVPFVQEGGKLYCFDLEWGSETSTDDAEGEVVATSAVRPAEDQVRAALPAFTGTILKRPPAFRPSRSRASALMIWRAPALPSSFPNGR